MDVCTLIILVKFQNVYTRISPPTVVPYGSNWKSWQDTSRCHWDFYSLAPGSKLTWYKCSHYRAKSPFSVQILKLLTMWFQNSYIFRPLNSVTFSPHPILLLPYLVFPVLLVGYRHWPALWWHLNQHIVQKHSITSWPSKHLQQTSSS